MASTALLLSCGNKYVEGYEALCEETRERVEKSESMEELLSVMKDFKNDVGELGEEYPEEMRQCRLPQNGDGSVNELHRRRVKAHNSVSKVAAIKWREFKKTR